jgi:hypothetical protein
VRIRPVRVSLKLIDLMPMMGAGPFPEPSHMSASLLQLVIIDMEDGRRGVFVGQPLVMTQAPDGGGEVAGVWFGEPQSFGDPASLERAARLALAELEGRYATLQ